MTTVVNTDVLTIKDNIVEINSSEIGPGVTVPSGLSGIQVNRGSLVSYQSVFRESDDAFCIGQTGDLQVVATREDVPLDSGVMIFNNTAKRLDSTTTLPLSMTLSSGETSTTSANGTLRVQGGVGITGDINLDGKLFIKGSVYDNYLDVNSTQEFIISSTGNILLNSGSFVKIPTSIPLSFGSVAHIITGNGSSITMSSTGPINIQAGTSQPVNLRTNSPLTFGTSTEKITYNGTSLTLDSNTSFVVNPLTSFTNNSSSISTTSGSVKYAGGISISNVSDASSSSNGGTLTTAGGVAIAKKLYVAGLSTFENVDPSASISTLGGMSVNKKLNIGSNYSGNPTATDAIFIQESGYTFTDNTTTASGGVSQVNFNFLGINELAASNSNITTATSSTLFIEGAPTAGTNQTITTSYALNVDNGKTRLNGDTQIESTTYSTALSVNGGVTIAKNLNVNNHLDVSGNINSAPSSNGVFLSMSPSTVTDNVTASGTVSEMLFNFIAQPTLSSTNTITTTNSATFSIGGAPIQSGGQTLVNKYALWIKSGAMRLDGDYIASGALNITNTTDATSSSNGGSITTAGGAGIAKKLYVGGVATFENNTVATNSTTAGTVVLGGLGVAKNVIFGQDTYLGFDNYSDSPGLGKILKTGGNVFTDNLTSASGTTASYSTNEFKQTTLSATNTGVTTTNAYTTYIAGPPIAGTNQTITNSYSFYVNSGLSKINGNLDVAGVVNANSNLNVQGNLDVNGATLLDQVTIDTTDGMFNVSGFYGVTFDVANTMVLRNTVGNVTVNSQAGSLVLNGNNSLTLDSTGSISIDAGASSNINTTSGTLTIGGPVIAMSSTSTTIQATSTTLGVKIATDTSSVPVSIGSSISETIIGDNLTVVGDLTVNGTTTTLNSTIITVNDNAIVVNSMPAGISDGGLLIRRYQTPNNIGAGGRVVLDTQFVAGVFQNDLQLALTESNVANYYRGWWMKITTGAAANYVRRIKSSDTNRVVTFYETADNSATFQDGLDFNVTTSTGDGYNLFPGTYTGMFFDDTNGEFAIANIPYDTNAGVFPVHGYKSLHVDSLIVDSGIGLSSPLILDMNNAQAILARKNGDSGDVFYVDTITPSISISNPVNTVASNCVIRLLGYDSINTEVLYSQILSEIKSNTTTSQTGAMSLGVVKNGTLENYIVLDASTSTVSTASTAKLTVLNTTASNNSTAAVIVTGGITSLTTTDATGYTSGGGLTTVGGSAVGKKLYVGTDAFFNSAGTGSGTIKIGSSSTGGEASVSFYGSNGYVGQTWVVGHSVSGSIAGEFGIYNSNTSSIPLSISTAGVVHVSTSTVSSSTTTGAMTIIGGLGIGGNLNVGGNISGTWSGTAITVPNGGTGNTTFTSTALLLGNGTSPIQSAVNLTYASSTLTLPKLISTDTTDASSSITGAIQIAGGVGIAKKLFVGTQLSTGGNIGVGTSSTVNTITLSGNSVIGLDTVDASDNGSISLVGGGSTGDSRGASVVVNGNESAGAGSLIITAGNVNSSGVVDIVTGSVSRITVNYNGVTTFNTTTDSSSSTTGSVTLAGGMGIAKKLYVGTDLNVSGNSSVGTVTSGTWNGNSIGIAYGGTGVGTFASTSLLIGNGTGSIQTSANLTFASLTLSTPKLSSTDTSQSTSTSTGAVVLAGGMGIAKNVYMGEDLFIVGNLGVGTTTNVNSALTLGANSNIGVNTVVTTDDGSLSISGSGVGNTTRGALGVLYGIDHATKAGDIALSAGSTTGRFTVSTGGSMRITTTTAGNTTFSKTGDSTSSTSAPVVVSGGLSISNTTNATSTTNGGALTCAGGASFNQDVRIGGTLYVSGGLPGGITVSSPSITTSSLVNLTSAVTGSTVKLRTITLDKQLSTTFVCVPSSVLNTCSFEFAVPGVVTNFTNSTEVVCTVNGYRSDFVAIENATAFAVVGTTNVRVKFTSGSTNSHILQISAIYEIV
jgi:hypothetical protein